MGVGLLIASSTTASACCKRRCNTNSCYGSGYYGGGYYGGGYYGYNYTLYKIWHVYKNDPATGGSTLVARYLTQAAANADPQVVAKTATVREETYYAP